MSPLPMVNRWLLKQNLHWFLASNLPSHYNYIVRLSRKIYLPFHLIFFPPINVLPFLLCQICALSPWSCLLNFSCICYAGCFKFFSWSTDAQQNVLGVPLTLSCCAQNISTFNSSIFHEFSPGNFPLGKSCFCSEDVLKICTLHWKLQITAGSSHPVERLPSKFSWLFSVLLFVKVRVF